MRDKVMLSYGSLGAAVQRLAEANEHLIDAFEEEQTQRRLMENDKLNNDAIKMTYDNLCEEHRKLIAQYKVLENDHTSLLAMYEEVCRALDYKEKELQALKAQTNSKRKAK